MAAGISLVSLGDPGEWFTSTHVGVTTSCDITCERMIQMMEVHFDYDTTELRLLDEISQWTSLADFCEDINFDTLLLIIAGDEMSRIYLLEKMHSIKPQKKTYSSSEDPAEFLRLTLITCCDLPIAAERAIPSPRVAMPSSLLRQAIKHPLAESWNTPERLTGWYDYISAEALFLRSLMDGNNGTGSALLVVTLLSWGFYSQETIVGVAACKALRSLLEADKHLLWGELVSLRDTSAGLDALLTVRGLQKKSQMMTLAVRKTLASIAQTNLRLFVEEELPARVANKSLFVSIIKDIIHYYPEGYCFAEDLEEEGRLRFFQFIFHYSTTKKRTALQHNFEPYMEELLVVGLSLIVSNENQQFFLCSSSSAEPLVMVYLQHLSCVSDTVDLSIRPILSRLIKMISITSTTETSIATNASDLMMKILKSVWVSNPDVRNVAYSQLFSNLDFQVMESLGISLKLINMICSIRNQSHSSDCGITHSDISRLVDLTLSLQIISSDECRDSILEVLEVLWTVAVDKELIILFLQSAHGIILITEAYSQNDSTRIAFADKLSLLVTSTLDDVFFTTSVPTDSEGIEHMYTSHSMLKTLLKKILLHQGYGSDSRSKIMEKIIRRTVELQYNNVKHNKRLVIHESPTAHKKRVMLWIEDIIKSIGATVQFGTLFELGNCDATREEFFARNYPKLSWATPSPSRSTSSTSSDALKRFSLRPINESPVKPPAPTYKTIPKSKSQSLSPIQIRKLLEEEDRAKQEQEQQLLLQQRREQEQEQQLLLQQRRVQEQEQQLLLQQQEQQQQRQAQEQQILKQKEREKRPQPLQMTQIVTSADYGHPVSYSPTVRSPLYKHPLTSSDYGPPPPSSISGMSSPTQMNSIVKNENHQPEPFLNNNNDSNKNLDYVEGTPKSNISEPVVLPVTGADYAAPLACDTSVVNAVTVVQEEDNADDKENDQSAIEEVGQQGKNTATNSVGNEEETSELEEHSEGAEEIAEENEVEEATESLEGAEEEEEEEAEVEEGEEATEDQGEVEGEETADTQEGAGVEEVTEAQEEAEVEEAEETAEAQEEAEEATEAQEDPEVEETAEAQGEAEEATEAQEEPEVEEAETTEVQEEAEGEETADTQEGAEVEEVTETQEEPEVEETTEAQQEPEVEEAEETEETAEAQEEAEEATEAQEEPEVEEAETTEVQEEAERETVAEEEEETEEPEAEDLKEQEDSKLAVRDKNVALAVDAFRTAERDNEDDSTGDNGDEQNDESARDKNLALALGAFQSAKTKEKLDDQNEEVEEDTQSEKESDDPESKRDKNIALAINALQSSAVTADDNNEEEEEEDQENKIDEEEASEVRSADEQIEKTPTEGEEGDDDAANEMTEEAQDEDESSDRSRKEAAAALDAFKLGKYDEIDSETPVFDKVQRTDSNEEIARHESSEIGTPSSVPSTTRRGSRIREQLPPPHKDNMSVYREHKERARSAKERERKELEVKDLKDREKRASRQLELQEIMEKHQLDKQLKEHEENELEEKRSAEKLLEEEKNTKRAAAKDAKKKQKIQEYQQQKAAIPQMKPQTNKRKQSAA